MDHVVTPRDDAPPLTSKHSEVRKAAAQDMGADAHASLSTHSVAINRPADELYRQWRAFDRLPGILENIERVDLLDEHRSHWVAKAPAGSVVEWDAVITQDIPGKLIAWRSEEGSEVRTQGTIRFEDMPGRGTFVTAAIAYHPPGGTLGKLIAKLFQREPAIQARRDLRRFKQLMETGEIATGARNRALLAEGKE